MESLTNKDGEGNPLSSYSYTYDGNGNIAAVTENGVTKLYTYDSLNRLVSSETETELHEYSYDGAGNLLSKSYFGKVGDEWILLDTDTYAYPAEAWQDLRISYNGESITYDELGNPLTYYGNRSFSWEGRELRSLSSGETTASYTYNASGIRTSKTVNGVTTNFSLEGSRILFMTGGSSFWRFLYYGDVLAGFKVNNATYYYLRNLQGDIVQIIDASGNVVVSYRYDDWGKVLSVTGSAAETLGVQNPFRYRGYFYDEETGLYYVSSRYYDPEVGRFISPDAVAILAATPMGLTDKNLYAYCDNNPICRADYGGECWLTCIAIGFVASIIAQYVADVVGNIKAEEENVFNPTSSVKDYLASGVSGAIAAIPGGGLIGALAVGAAGNIAGDLIRGEISNVRDLGNSALMGAVANGVGYGIGKIMAHLKVNQINNMSRDTKKAYLRDVFYQNSQKNVNTNLKMFLVNPIEQVEKRFWVFRAGIYSTITSTSIGKMLE